MSSMTGRWCADRIRLRPGAWGTCGDRTSADEAVSGPRRWTRMILRRSARGERLWPPARRVRSWCRGSWGRGVAPSTRPACILATTASHGRLRLRNVAWGGVRMGPGPVMGLLCRCRSGRRRVVPPCHRADASPRLHGLETRHARVRPLGARAHDPPSVRRRPTAARTSNAA
jgi:hypothetical protein